MPYYNQHIYSKLPKIGTTIFTTMSNLANDHGAINLSQGFPDFDVDERLKHLAIKYIKKGPHQYAPMQGALPLREAIYVKVNAMYNASYDVEKEITITAGATQAIYTAISAIIKENDEVILFTPAYDCYEPAIEICGGKPVFIQLQAPDFAINWEEVKKLISPKTRMIIINSPHNPTGSVLTKRDFIALEKIISDTGIIVLSDEVYEHLVYDDHTPQSVVSYPKLASSAIAVFSFGKTFHVTGWKLGYVLAPENLMHEFRKVHQFNVFSCNHPFQLAIAEYIKDEENYLTLSAFYNKKRKLFLEMVNASRFKAVPSKGTYFQLLNYEEISSLPDIEMAKKMTIENKLASIPISVFYHSKKDPKFLRFCFAKKDETLKKAGEILTQL